ncbi:GNAT family N-acetyltransferase [Anaerocolumna xylanovorans]|uniref:Acetyltransferase (GNAT) domain-containing protein n=1 Tax=Anaerocolumna xylanovorans DSM 12503 TaxID=1121345 RepID=A0A1M7Y6Y9_9FIRM|nr:GNAT family N-acetyltransferase [Anaerocolumna xylanovorans]SHO48361.1 Acetyltransferase (GNAT) domain-containing protein [Anaerocolumna xylanovorans DSM 12503]
MILYETLDKISNETLHQTFVEAFSDYQVKIDLPYWKFQQMIQRRGYNPEISAGAFKNQKLVGFALTGLRSWNGKTTAYDIATGIIPECRRQGITSNILAHIKNLLKEKQVEQYLLEVIKTNQPALELYQKQGFQIQREFSCFQLNKNKFIQGGTWEAEKVNRIDFQQVEDFWDCQPSWQNSAASVEALLEAFTCFVVRLDDAIAGYGIIDKKTGDIPQIAVSKSCRGKGIASSIMAELVKTAESERIAVINIETPQNPIENFLTQLGFESHVGQYEMLMKL